MVHKIVDALAALNAPYDILLMGHNGVGKTSLIYRYVNDSWCDPSSAPAGLLHLANVVVPSHNNCSSCSPSKGSAYHDLTIFDSPSLSEGTYSTRKAQEVKNARTIIFAYSIADRESFDALQYDIEAVKVMRNNELPPFVVAGLKLDVFDSQTLYQEGAELAEKNGAIAFAEVSSRDGINVEDVFSPLVEVILQNKPGLEHNLPDMLSLLDVLSGEPDTPTANVSLQSVNNILQKESSGEVVMSSASATLTSLKKQERTTHNANRYPQSEKSGCCIIT